MKTISKYTLSKTINPFLVSLFVVMTALLLERLLVLFGILAEGNNKISIFVRLLSMLTPHYLGLAIPAALCVSIFFIMQNMSQNEEIDAINSMGISLSQLARSFVVVGVVFSIISFLLYGFIQPYARYDFRKALYTATHTGWAPRLQSGKFVSPSGKLTLFADNVNSNGDTLYHVFIRDLSNGKEQDITARQGNMYVSSATQNIQIDLNDGYIVTDDKKDSPSTTYFTHATRILSGKSYMGAFHARGDDERELTFLELIIRLKNGNYLVPYSDMYSQMHFILARSVILIFIPLLSISLAMSQKRKKNRTGLVIALIILVGLDHTLQLSHSLMATKNLSAIFMWVPPVLFGIVCTIVLLYKSGDFQGRIRR